MGDTSLEVTQVPEPNVTVPAVSEALEDGTALDREKEAESVNWVRGGGRAVREELMQGFEREVESPPQLPPLQLLGTNDEFRAYPLDECQGSCTEDFDCLEGLKCFQRNDNEPIPGCQGLGPIQAAGQKGERGGPARLWFFGRRERPGKLASQFQEQGQTMQTAVTGGFVN